MIELVAIILQFFIFLIIFSFPFNPKNLNKILKNSENSFNYIDCQAVNIIILAGILLVLSFFNINLKNIFYVLLLLSLVMLIKRNKEYLLLFNRENFFKFIFFSTITMAIFISTSYVPRLEWDGFHWIQKAILFFNNTEIQNLKHVGMPEYPHLGAYIWAFFWKNSLLQHEYLGRLFYIYFYIISLFTIFNSIKLESKKIIYILTFSLIIITYDRYLFGGYQEYLIFSTLLVASRFISTIKFKNNIEHNKIILILFFMSILMWFKDEGIFYFLIFGSLLIIMQKCEIKFKLLYLFGIIFLIFAQHYLQKNVIGIYGFSTEFLSQKVINQILDIKIIIYKTALITKHMLIAFLKYPLWIIIILSLIFLKSFKVDYLRYLFYALILNFLFLYAIYINDPSPITKVSTDGTELLYEFVLSVTLDRVIFQTSGFYILLFLSILNSTTLISKKNN